MNEIAGKFFADQKSEQLKAAQAAMDGASGEERKTVPIDLPGNYLCEVATFAFTKEGKDRQFPELYISDEKKSLNMTVVLKVVDGTDKVPKGASIFSNITLCPGGDTFDQDTADKIMSFTKPKLITLTGCTKINLTPDWIDEWLIPTFEKKDKTFILVKDHKMKNKVMAVVDYDKKGNIAVKSFTKALPTDHSSTYATAAAQQSNMQIPAATAPSFASIVDHGDGPADIPHVPEVEDF